MVFLELAWKANSAGSWSNLRVAEVRAAKPEPTPDLSLLTGTTLSAHGVSRQQGSHCGKNFLQKREEKQTNQLHVNSGTGWQVPLRASTRGEGAASVSTSSLKRSTRWLEALVPRFQLEISELIHEFCAVSSIEQRCQMLFSAHESQGVVEVA